MWRYIILILLIVLVIYFLYQNQNQYEGYNDQTGKLCFTCGDKTFNQCQQCFNCGFCVDRWGNSKCLGGDETGPFNYEDCALWYYGDPWSRMMQNNKKYKCSYGPKASNREIGINPTCSLPCKDVMSV